MPQGVLFDIVQIFHRLIHNGNQEKRLILPHLSSYSFPTRVKNVHFGENIQAPVRIAGDVVHSVLDYM